MRPYDTGAVYTALTVRNHLYEPIGFTLRLRPVVLAERPTQDPDIVAKAFLCLIFGLTYVRKFGGSISHPGHGLIVHLCR